MAELRSFAYDLPFHSKVSAKNSSCYFKYLTVKKTKSHIEEIQNSSWFVDLVYGREYLSL